MPSRVVSLWRRKPCLGRSHHGSAVSEPLSSRHHPVRKAVERLAMRMYGSPFSDRVSGCACGLHHRPIIPDEDGVSSQHAASPARNSVIRITATAVPRSVACEENGWISLKRSGRLPGVCTFRRRDLQFGLLAESHAIDDGEVMPNALCRDDVRRLTAEGAQVIECRKLSGTHVLWSTRNWWS